MTRHADVVIWVACTSMATWLWGYQVGYDEAKSRCKPIINQEIKPMSELTIKQQVRAIRWSMRDKGYIK